MKLRILFVLVFLMCRGIAHADQVRDHFVAPSVLPNTTRYMQTAGYWVRNIKDPHKIILSPKEIVDFNKHVRENLGLTQDIFSMTQVLKIEVLIHYFETEIKDFIKKDLYTLAGIRDSHDLLEKARINSNHAGLVLGVAPRYGLVVHYADVRFLPTDLPLYESPGDIDFDQMQNSTLDVGEAVMVVHQSLDHQWFYVITGNCQGWVKADHIALGDVKLVRSFSEGKNVAVVLAAKADIFLDKEMTQQHDFIRMGTRLPLLSVEDNQMVVRVPAFDQEKKLRIVDGYVIKRDFHEGYLPYTSWNILTQAFVMLNQPYGWGGMHGDQDCSAFLDEVFATVGIKLPRDSKDQSQVGQEIAVFDVTQKNDARLKSFENLMPGETILPMKGHIMLFLGNVSGRSYAIHCVWAYREHSGGKDIVRVINRVAVTDLFLGEGSVKGSLLKRLTKIVSIQ